MSEAKHPRTNYVAIWAWLIGLLIISLASVNLPFSQTAVVTLIFLIALAKALIIAFYFMHLRTEKLLINLIALVPVLLFVILVLSLVPDVVFNR